MLAQAIKQTALYLLVRAVRENNQQLATSYWDLMYIYRFGIPKIETPDPNDPIPGVSPVNPPVDLQIQMHEELIFGLLDAVDRGDPEPQPNITGILTNKKIRLSAAKNLATRLVAAQKQLNAEIARLEALK